MGGSWPQAGVRGHQEYLLPRLESGFPMQEASTTTGYMQSGSGSTASAPPLPPNTQSKGVCPWGCSSCGLPLGHCRILSAMWLSYQENEISVYCTDLQSLLSPGWGEAVLESRNSLFLFPSPSPSLHTQTLFLSVHEAQPSHPDTLLECARALTRPAWPL